MLLSFFQAGFFLSRTVNLSGLVHYGSMLPHGINLSIAEKLPNINKNGLEYCNMEACSYIWFTAI